MKDPYSVLGISPNATDEEVKKAYRAMARKFHPDNYQNNPLADLAEEKMKEINEAYDTITRQRASDNYRQQPTGGTSSGYYETQYSASSGDPLYAKVRDLIRGAGFNPQNLIVAEQLLERAPTRDAEWYFLQGNIDYHRGWLMDAMNNINTAVEMDPMNVEYRNAKRMFEVRSHGVNTQRSDMSDCCTVMMCSPCCYWPCC